MIGRWGEEGWRWMGGGEGGIGSVRRRLLRAACQTAKTSHVSPPRLMESRTLGLTSAWPVVRFPLACPPGLTRFLACGLAAVPPPSTSPAFLGDELACSDDDGRETAAFLRE